MRVGAGTIRTTTPGLDVTTQPEAQFAIFKFTVKNANASATIDVKPLIITIGTQDYTITPASATSTLYAALPAVSGQTVSFYAAGSDSKTYTCSKDGVTSARWCAPQAICTTRRLPFPQAAPPWAFSAR